MSFELSASPKSTSYQVEVGSYSPFCAGHYPAKRRNDSRSSTSFVAAGAQWVFWSRTFGISKYYVVGRWIWVSSAIVISSWFSDKID